VRRSGGEGRLAPQLATGFEPSGLGLRHVHDLKEVIAMPESAARPATTKRRKRIVSKVKVVVVDSVAAETVDDYLVSSPESVHQLPMLRELMCSSDREVFVCLHLNTKNRLISWEVVSVGSLTEAIVHPRELFKAAILANAASVVLAHNHVSGDPEPSLADIRLTKRLAKAGELLGIQVLDHVIFGQDGCASLRERNVL
jgi:DNA repair protein RadC